MRWVKDLEEFHWTPGEKVSGGRNAFQKRTAWAGLEVLWGTHKEGSEWNPRARSSFIQPLVSNNNTERGISRGIGQWYSTRLP